MSKNIECEDHDGNKFNSISEMCIYYNIRVPTYLSRLKQGMSVKEALTKPTNRESIIDFRGKQFKTMTEMCHYYNKSCDTVKCRLAHQWTLKEALLIPIESKRVSRDFSCEDHLGKKYTSKSEMCRKYEISKSLFDYRIKHGWSLEDALTIKNGRNYTPCAIEATA